MRLIKFGRNLILLAIIFNFLYTAYYGFNKEPINETEKTLDTITQYMINFGIIAFIIPLFWLYEHKVEQYERIKNRKKQKEKDQAIPWHKHEEFREHPRQGHTEK